MSDQHHLTKKGLPGEPAQSQFSKFETLEASQEPQDHSAEECAQTIVLQKDQDDFEAYEPTQTLSSELSPTCVPSLLSVSDIIEEESVSSESTSKAKIEFSSRYELRSQLGEGGMGEVYAVKDHLLKREVALKKIRGQSNDRVQEAFVREARILAQLSHPSIVPIHDLHIPQTSQNSSAYFTMEKVGGETLNKHIKRFIQCSPQEASVQLFHLLNIFVDIGKAIDYAHKRGVLHRDLKPDNVMIGEHGQVKVLDWGLGGQLSQQEKDRALNADLVMTFTAQKVDQERFTFTGTISGTPAYMSPEQARGESLSEQTDIYALGAILYEILSGEAPYVRVFKDDPRCAWLILEQAQRAKIAPPLRRDLCPHPHLVNRYLLRICEKALQSKPSQRYASVHDMLEELKDYLSGESQRSRIQATKEKVKQLYTSTTEQILIHQQAISLWERLQASNNVPLVAHFRSQVLHLLEDLVRWDKADIESRIWGLHLRYHYVMFQWWRGELNIAYNMTTQILKDRCQKLDLFQDTALGAQVPWTEVECLKNQQRRVHLQFHFSPDDELMISIRKLKQISHIDEIRKNEARQKSEQQNDESQNGEKQAKDLPYTFGQALKLNLEWGHYALDLKVRNKQFKYRLTQLVRVKPSLIPIFEGSELLNLDEYQALKAQSVPIQNDLFIDLYPAQDIERFAQTRSAHSLSPKSLGAKFKLFNHHSNRPPMLEEDAFEWIAPHTLSIGTWQAMARTNAPDEVECGGIWLQKNQVTIGAYLHYINQLDELIQALPAEEQVIPYKDLKMILPNMTLNFLELKDQFLFTRQGVEGPFVISPAMQHFRVNEGVPMFQVSFADIERYLLWLSWETGVAWTLPSEHEWELAARGVDQRTFPWGEADAAKLTQMRRSSASPFDGREALTSGDPYLLSRDRRSELYPHDLSPFGIESMGGGMSDWTMKDDLKREQRQQLRTWLKKVPSVKQSPLERARALFNAPEWRRCFNEDFSFGQRHLNEQVIRGGSYLNETEQCTTMYRVEAMIHKRFIDVSFRLAYEPE